MEKDEQQNNCIVVDYGTEYKEDPEVDDEKELIEIKQEESFFESAFREMRQSLMENNNDNSDLGKDKAKEEEELKKKKKEELAKEWEIV